MTLQQSTFASLPDGDFLNAPEETIICTTNIVGAMGRGIALSVKQRWPHIYNIYRDTVTRGAMYPNTLMLIPVSDTQRVLLFPTKLHWKDPSVVELIEDNLDKLICHGEHTFNIKSLAIPPLGMGNGWLTGSDAQLVINAIERFALQVSYPCTYYT